MAASSEDQCEIEVVHFDAVRAARTSLPADSQLGRIADLLTLLSNPTRLRMLLALQPNPQKPYDELCVCDLAVVAGVSPSMTSHQLRLLRTAGLVVARRDGKLVYYRLAKGDTAALLRDALNVATREMIR